MPRNLRSGGKSATAAPVAAGPSSTKTKKKGQTQKSKSKSAADDDMTDAKSLLRLPSDAVSSALLYLDVDGVPKAAVMCKEWNAILQSVEEELWLSLVRKHHPIAERIARKLPPPATSIANSVDEVDDQQPPAKRGRIAIDWKDQFRRAREMSKQDKVPSPESTTIARPEPKPLSSYFFQVDLVLYKGVEGQKTSEWEKTGVVSTVVDGDDMKFDKHNFIELCIKSEDIAEELGKHSFTSFDIKLVLFQKSTGKRAFFYQGGIEECCDQNLFRFETSTVTKCVFDSRLTGIDIPGDPWVCCELFVSKNGCPDGCCNSKPWDLFASPCLCKCSSCRGKKDAKWIGGLEIELYLELSWDWDISPLEGKRRQLEVLELVTFM